jgi:hypothetical protein
MTLSIGLPSSLLRDITDKAAAQVLLGMRQDDGCSCSRVLKYVMRAGDTFDKPAFALQTTLYIAAVGEHPIPNPYKPLLTPSEILVDAYPSP